MSRKFHVLLNLTILMPVDKMIFSVVSKIKIVFINCDCNSNTNLQNCIIGEGMTVDLHEKTFLIHDFRVISVQERAAVVF